MKRLAKRGLCVVFAAWATLCVPSAAAQPGETLKRVQQRGALWCGVDRSEAEYSSGDEHGSRIAFDLDLCKAVAIAALGPGAAMKATFYADDATSLDALANGKVDLVASLGLDAQRTSRRPGDVVIAFSDPVLYDAVGVMVPRASNVQHAAQLSGRKICFLTETHTEERLHAWFAARHLDLLPFPFQEEGEMEAAFVTDNCTGLAGELTRLAQTRNDTGTRAPDYLLLPETMGDDPAAMAYRLDDAEWKALIDATLKVLFAGDEAIQPHGQAPANHVICQSPPTPDTQKQSKALPLAQLPSEWAKAILDAVGTYNALFARDLEEASALRLPRYASATAHQPCAVATLPTHEGPKHRETDR